MNALQIIGLTLAGVGLVWLLWDKGWFILKTMTVLVFTGKPYGGAPLQLKASKATGTLRRRIPLKAGKYRFRLDSALSAGSVSAKLVRSVVLDEDRREVELTMGGNKSIDLVLTLDHADGDVTLTWESVA